MPDVTSRASWLADITLTNDARNVLQRAGSFASARGLPPEDCDAADVLLALMQARGTLAERTIRALGVDPDAVIRAIPPRDGAAGLPARQVVLNAYREAQVLGHYQVDSIHLLLAMLYSDTPATSAALQGAGISLYDLRRHLQSTTVPTDHGGSRRVENRADAALRRRPLNSLRGAVTLSPVFLGLVAFTVATGAALWFNLFPQQAGVVIILFVLGGWVISLCVHEFAHAAVAYLAGDTSVATQGYLSFNPLRYANLFMSTILPILFLLLGGIGLPGGAVYINHAAIRSRAWDSAVSLAGPVGTALCALAIMAVFSVIGQDTLLTSPNGDFFSALAFLGFVEVSAVVLNLIPVPGLDGFGIIAPWLPLSARYVIYRYATFAMIGLFVALWYLPPVRDAYFQTIFSIAAIGNIDPVLVLSALSRIPHL
ncbi:MAG TPA: Clp protease N-terminal domain-containing protein [Candidatus Dormibacteraeota bacterium]|nr:Clp protease N-terminal domain-containing protein [Candidatus Dormibacteraeota bacterium]